MRATAILALAAAVLATGCASAPAPAGTAAAPGPEPVEGETYAVRHASWPAGREISVVYRDGRFRPL